MNNSSSKATLVLERPEGITDGRWAALEAQAHLIITGHMPWCDEHLGVEDGERGYCTASMRSVHGEALVHDGTTDGRIRFNLTIGADVNIEELTVGQARALALVLTEAANLAQLWKAGEVLVD